MKSKRANTDLILVLSTTHLSSATCAAIRGEVDFGVRAYVTGRRIVIQLREVEFDAGVLPDDLRDIVDYTFREGCGWIAFDEFAPVDRNLPQYS